MKKLELKHMVKMTITKVSANWYIAIKHKKKDIAKCKKNIYHSIRILQFALQIAEQGKIYNYAESNELKKEIFDNPDEEFNLYRYLHRRDEMIGRLKTKAGL